jgi:4-amino-4-deoxy-L-arabinose transferase-like glycosyltransferase
MGLAARVVVWQVFRTAQVQDFGRAHEVYMMIANYGSFEPAYTWADFSWYQLYYARFPAWFPFFVVTRLVYDVFGAYLRNMILLNYLLFGVSAAIFYAAAKRLFPFAVAFTATAVFALNPIFVFWSAITSPDHFFILLFVCMFYFFSRHGEGGKFLALAAAFAALTNLFKPIGIMFLIAYFCMEFFVQIVMKSSPLVAVVKANWRKWAAFTVVFLAVLLAGNALVRFGIQRTFHVGVYSSTGKFLAMAWQTDDYGNYSHGPSFDRFNELMAEHDSNLPVVLDEMSRYAWDVFRDAPHLSVLWQKMNITFADEGVLGWVFNSQYPEITAAAHRLFAGPLWVGFTAHIFVLMAFAAVGAFFAIFDRKNKTVLVFLMTTVIGYTFVLLLGIAQARYRILLYPQLSLFAAIGLKGLLSYFHRTRAEKGFHLAGETIVGRDPETGVG